MKAVLAGAFDPFTTGHLYIASRAERLFGEVVIAVAADTGKNTAPLADRLDMVRASVSELEHVAVEPFTGLLSDFLTANMPCVLVRGLRGARDLEYERDLCRVYESMCDAECVYLIADAAHEHISSTVVRQLAEAGAGLSGYVSDKITQKAAGLYAKGKKE